MSTTRQNMLKLLHGEDPGEIIVCPLIDSWVLEDEKYSEMTFGEDFVLYSKQIIWPIRS